MSNRVSVVRGDASYVRQIESRGKANQLLRQDFELDANQVSNKRFRGCVCCGVGCWELPWSAGVEGFDRSEPDVNLLLVCFQRQLTTFRLPVGVPELSTRLFGLGQLPVSDD
jgi:hypothetical protein